MKYYDDELSKGNNIRALFRVDSSLKIGTGHLMRCLTLAGKMAEHNIQSTFVCRNLLGNINSLATARGHTLIELDGPSSAVSETDWSIESESPYHTAWLEVPLFYDAEQTAKIVKVGIYQYVVIDHYALDRRWEEYVCSDVEKVVVIDDLADRQHYCNTLLDQTLDRSPADYDLLVPKSTTILSGTTFCLLRAEFLAWREASLKNRQAMALENITIAMGGVDPENLTISTLKSILPLCMKRSITINVVIGEKFPFKTDLFKIASEAGVVIIYEAIENMAELMSKTDLMIHASGSITWERCCLGVPAIMTSFAKNQELIANNVEKRGAAICVSKTQLDSLPSILSTLNVENMMQLSNASAELVDGKGAQRVVEAILSE